MNGVPPEMRGNLLPRDELTAAFGQEDHELKRDSFKLHCTRLVEELEASDVELEISEVPPGSAQNSAFRSFYTRSPTRRFGGMFLLQESFR
jgi:hypothetical protein